MPLVEPERAASRLAPLLILTAVVLVPWTLYLGYRLPASHTSHGWDIAWIGFDIALALMLALTGAAIVRRSTLAPVFAAVAATLLCCDAWFDNVLASGASEHMEAAVEAAFAEIPLALVCLWLAHNGERTIAEVLEAARRSPHEPPGDEA
jgi:hypothetical protein